MNQALTWFLKNKNQLCFKIDEFTWPKDYNLPLFDFESQMTIQNQSFVGRGIHSSFEGALLKSFAEATERFFCHHENLGFCGVSVHQSEQKALEHAEDELIEKEAYLNFLHNGDYQAQAEVLDEFFLQKENIHLRFFKLFSSKKCVILAKSDQNILGLGIHKQVEQAQEKALQELLMNLVHVLDNPDEKVRPIIIGKKEDLKKINCEIKRTVFSLSETIPLFLNCPLYFAHVTRG